jgi:antimicrobial peptide system SdpB family protein
MFMIRKIGQYAVSLTSKHNPWTNVYGLARSFLAFGTFITLLFNPSNNLFRPSVGLLQFPVCDGFKSAGIFCMAAPHLEIARWLSIIILLVVIIGWRPRYTGILHWWIAISLQSSAVVTDGGDQVTTVLTLLLLPVTLTDDRKWHWQDINNRNDSSTFKVIKSLFAIVSLGAIRVQVSIIYFHAATAKFALEEWMDGTILYYWLNDPMIGLSNWLKFILPIFSSRFVVAFTWGTLLLEILLSMGIFMQKKYWRPLLIAGILFHLGIALMMGLISFGCAMIAALILYLHPFDDAFHFFKLKDVFSRLLTWKSKLINTPLLADKSTK